MPYSSSWKLQSFEAISVTTPSYILSNARLSLDTTLTNHCQQYTPITMHYDVHLNEVSPCLTATEKNMNLVLIEYSRTVEDHDVSDESFRILILTTRNGDNKGPLQVALKHLTIAGNV